MDNDLQAVLAQMAKKRAIGTIRDIQNGNGKAIANLEDETFNSVLGSVARRLIEKHDNNFLYGMEYGYIAALICTFEITLDDLKSPNEPTKDENQ